MNREDPEIVGSKFAYRYSMRFSYQIPVLPQGALPQPELLLLQVQRDNLVRMNRRLVQQIEEISRQIELETQRGIEHQERIQLHRKAMTA